MIATIISVVLTIGLDLVFLGPLEQGGLALASAIAVYVNTLITLWFLRRTTPEMSLRALASQQGRMLIAGAGALLVALVPFFLMPEGNTFGTAVAWLVVVSAVGGVAFVALCRLLAPAELADARTSIRNLRGRRAAR